MNPYRDYLRPAARSLWRRLLYDKDGYALTYHHVLPPGKQGTGPIGQNSVTSAHFEEQLQFLKDNFVTVTPGEYFQAGGFCGEPFVMLTFDDGYLDNLTHALPLLEEYDVPATFFVTTGYVSGEFYPFEVELWDLLDAATTFEIEVDGEERRINTTEAGNQIEAYSLLFHQWRALEYREKQDKLGELQVQADVEVKRRSDLFMGWDDVQRINQSEEVQVEFYPHGYSHVPLAAQNQEVTRREVDRSLGEFEENLGFVPEFFSYPYGKHSELARDLLRDAGVDFAFTTRESPVYNTDVKYPLRLPRVEVPDVSTDSSRWTDIFTGYWGEML